MPEKISDKKLWQQPIEDIIRDAGDGLHLEVPGLASKDQPDDGGDWKETAKKILKSYYLGFSGTQWHQFDKSTDNDIMRAKICFAMFGEFRIGFVFVCCKHGVKQFHVPVFSVFVGPDRSGRDLRTFLDLQGRTYKDWDDWKSNNCLPELEYYYPKRGFFTCSGDESYTFDAERDPDVEFGKSPACKTSSQFLSRTDTLSKLTFIGSGIVAIAGYFTPLGPVVLATAVRAGITSTAYSAIRGASRLYDKGVHGESLVDFESLTLWLEIVAAPLQFTSSFDNARLVAGAQQGRIYSNSIRNLAFMLNFTTLGVDGVMVGFGLAELIDKASKKEVTALDVVHFSMSVFFFSNTLMEPKVASSIIRQAQEMHLNSYMDKMSDVTIKETFKYFMDRNRGAGGIKDTSKIIRTVNRMKDPNSFFKSLSPDDKIDIGGRKGQTVLVSDAKGDVNRINPNRMIQSEKGPDSSEPFNFKEDYRKPNKCDRKDANDVD
ncbi:uncharacterized protein LOC106077339 [Biomphalaria glabrata]|uniref:Uncharacterized protein LOC106077339 n=1 Tax=Biomphalaria glabrata TaxID=6526 RepID=A0A9W3BCJ9_BIOGL|nr:uncharacterized protein LOC106077339 [Biomphalaria glabrata]